MLISLVASGCGFDAGESAERHPVNDFLDVGASLLVQRHIVGDSLYSSHLCGGLLIDDSRAVTARHCVVNRTASDLAIVTSVSDLCGVSDPDVRPVHAIQYAQDGRLDIVILNLTPDAGAIPLPDFDRISEGDQLTAVGWGSASEGGFFGCDMKQIPLAVSRHPLCDSGMPGAKGTFFCAHGTEAINTCAGDSGSPVFRAKKGVFRPVGITVGGVGCEPADIGVYFSLHSLGHAFEGIDGEEPSATARDHRTRP